MAEIILVTGGSRSGKSTFAQSLAESVEGQRAYIATCPVIDKEMRERVLKHQQARSRHEWLTIEETTDLARILRESEGFSVFLVDCLTLWINNLMYEAESKSAEVTEEDVSRLCCELLSVCSSLDSTVIFVTNEVGMGIIPDNASARRFRDLSGRASQIIASGADKVYLVTCGIPIAIKDKNKVQN